MSFHSGASIEDSRRCHSPPPRAIGDARAQHAEAVGHRAAEADLARILEVARRARNLADAHVEGQRLREHLVVEDEVLRIGAERQRLEHAPGECAEAGVVFRQARAGEHVLEAREHPVGVVLVARHAARERALAEHARAERHVVDAGGHERGERGDEPRLVLIVGVQHHDDVRARGERGGIAGLLVGAVARVGAVADRLQPEALGDGERRVVAGVVDEEHVIDDVVRDCAIARLEGLLRAVGGHDDDCALTVDHAKGVRKTCRILVDAGAATGRGCASRASRGQAPVAKASWQGYRAGKRCQTAGAKLAP